MVRRRPCLLLLALLPWPLTLEAQSLPRVYADEYVEVRSVVRTPDDAAAQIGTVLELATDVIFDPGEVRIEALDGDYFQREFARLAAVRQAGEVQSATDVTGDGRTRIATRWSFQVLDCPADRSPCPGVRQYPLPLFSLAYKVDAGGRAEGSERAARFTPWPGKLVLVPSIAIVPDARPELADVVPGAAFPAAAGPPPPATWPWVALLAGALLLAAGGARRRGTQHAGLAPAGAVDFERRWQQAGAALQTAPLDDEEWADLLRRALVWYGLDELGRNPYDSATPPADTDEYRAFFTSVLNEARIDPARRDHFLDRFRHLTGMPAVADGARRGAQHA